MEQLLLPPSSHAYGTIKLPGSKSISNRTLLLAALSDNTTTIRDLLISDDTNRMLEALQILGVKLEGLENKNDWKITGCTGDFPNKNSSLFLGNAGTAFRPLTAALALSHGSYNLHGVPRMHERPIGDLVDALRQIGASVDYLGQQGFPPLQIHSGHLDLSKPIQIRGDVSSQFLTALLMALPITGQQARIHVIGELISKPYIEITLNLMARFGIQVSRENWQEFIIPEQQQYHSPETFYVEGDASSASYFLAAGAIAGQCKVVGVSKNSIQGDVRFCEALQRMGTEIIWGDNYIESKKTTAIQAIDMDCNHIPDAAMTLAVLALFAEGTTTLRNIASWRVKETDRITAMATELRKVGAFVKEGPDYISITPPDKLIPNAVIDTYDDHRMAMCFSLVSLGNVPIIINEPMCVAKTFPDYFTEFGVIAQGHPE